MPITFQEKDNIGIISFDDENSKVNLLSADNIKRLDQVLDEVAKKISLKALIFMSRKKDVFIAGADIKEIEKIVEPKDGEQKAKAGQDIFNKIEDLKIPTIAFIDGVALGGGCELALSCLYRIATFNDKVKIGLPEVNLGFVPGFGGTYRLPRIVGLSEGLKLILAGRPIDASKALKINLFDALIAQKGSDIEIFRITQDIISGKIKKKRYDRPKKKGMADFLDEAMIGNFLVFRESKKSVLKASKGFYPAPLKAIEVIKENFYCNRPKALAIEARAFGSLAITDVSKNLVQVFYLSEKFKKLSLDGAENISTPKIESCGVVGAGVMGGGIAQALSARGIWARMKDINYDAIAKGMSAAAKVYGSAVKTRKLTKSEAAVSMARISGTVDYSGFSNVDMVIEAVVENMDVKKKVFKELSEITNGKAILATNTSSLSVTEMAKEAKDPSKVIGFHFFNPVHRMPLIEIITTPQTSKETIVASLNLAKQLGKTPILVKDSCGFIVNRILLGYINEAGRLLEETGQMEAIDKSMTDFGMPMGPFTLSDEVGLDVGIKVLHILHHHLGSRFKASEIFEKVSQKGLLGKKSGKGYYIHGSKRTVNPEIAKMLDIKTPKMFNVEDCQKRLVYMMINEAAQCLEEKIVDDAGSIDIGMIFGTGFPPFRGGLLRYADSIGISNIVTTLERFEKELNSDRFRPSPYLLQIDKMKSKFYV